MPSTGIEIVPYDSEWPSLFEAEAARIRSALGPTALRIDHNGSTSIPGMRAKPVIDIQVSVATLQPLSVFGDPLTTLGYHHVPHPDDAFCPFFHRPADWPHTHHIHVVEHGGLEERRTLAFRDYVRDHHDAALEYEHIKVELAGRLVGADHESRESYARAKSEFIERIVSRALESGYGLS
jgi:GrpB-like predicted nucleotidyltransferase (UPF0157 family)